MTDADLARQEWLDERAAVLEFEAKFPRDEAERLALVMWAAKVQRENASAEHGDAPGARGGERMSSASPIASQNSRLTR
ncbi:MAG: hypothetical protein RLZZ460_119 [Chloroflexota bacterium]|jgi:hypothetical protein